MWNKILPLVFTWELNQIIVQYLPLAREMTLGPVKFYINYKIVFVICKILQIGLLTICGSFVTSIPSVRLCPFLYSFKAPQNFDAQASLDMALDMKNSREENI